MTVPYAPRGLHHVTAIAGDPVENLRFYRDVMGLRLVKKSVNQDDPATYHLFYADADGHPGTDLTFFPWPHAKPGNPGVGVVQETYLTVPHGTIDAWEARLRAGGARVEPPAVRFGERVLPFADPHGLRLALVEGATPFAFTAWDASPVPEGEQIRGLHGARAPLRELAPTERFLTEVMGFERVGTEGDWVRFTLPASAGAAAADGAGRVLDLREVPDGRRGAWGVGSVHHLAWTVDDDAHQVALRGAVARAGRRPSEVIDRFWFRSVYFMEPGGVLFELATTGPGFAVDEDPSALGERLILPPWLEPHRSEIEGVLPDLSGADRSRAAAEGVR
jgi:glyoxalase family protein